MEHEKVKRLKQIIIDKFNPGLSVEELDDNMPLVDYGIGLDSVANMELILEIEKYLGIEIDESDINSEILYSFRSLKKYLESLTSYNFV